MNKTNFIRCLFILNVFVCLAKLESGLDVTAGHSTVTVQSAIELIVSSSPSYDITFYGAPSSPTPSSEFSGSGAALSSINKYTLIDYNAFALRVLNSSNIARNYSLQLVLIVQKCSVWHQSSGVALPQLV
jgi:hypothetical protein